MMEQEGEDGGRDEGIAGDQEQRQDHMVDVLIDLVDGAGKKLELASRGTTDTAAPSSLSTILQLRESSKFRVPMLRQTTSACRPRPGPPTTTKAPLRINN